jgi:acyl-CoA synthetase (NDP forming)
MSFPKGRRTLLIGPGGGASVIAADDCSRAGLTVPILPAGSREKLKQLMGTETGGGFRNPVDLYRPDLLKQTVEAVGNWDEFDVLLVHLPFELYGLMPDATKDAIRSVFVQAVLDIRESPFKPHAVVLHASTAEKSRQQAIELRAKLSQAGFAVFESIERAASAINKAIKYYEWRQRAMVGDNGRFL